MAQFTIIPSMPASIVPLINHTLQILVHHFKMYVVVKWLSVCKTNIDFLVCLASYFTILGKQIFFCESVICLPGDPARI